MNLNENSNEKIEWTALEYEEKERSKDWFWALGIIVVTSAITVIIYENYFFAALLLLGGTLLGYFSHKKPETISYELNVKGVKIGNFLYVYANIKSFHVQTEDHTGWRPTLFIKTDRMFMPIISIPIDDAHLEIIHNKMLENNVPEEEMREHSSEKIMDFLGF